MSYRTGIVKDVLSHTVTGIDYYSHITDVVRKYLELEQQIAFTVVCSAVSCINSLQALFKHEPVLQYAVIVYLLPLTRTEHCAVVKIGKCSNRGYIIKRDVDMSSREIIKVELAGITGIIVVSDRGNSK